MLQKLAEDLSIFVRHAARVHGKPLACFEIAKLGRFLEREIDLRGIEDLENDDVVALLAKMCERHVDGGFVSEKIGNHYHQRAPPNRAGNFMQRIGDAGSRVGRQLLDVLQHVVQMLK